MQLVEGQARQVAYAADLRSDYKLLEVDENLLKEIAADGVTIKGGAGDDAVLCSNRNTYAIKYVETTNLMLLAPAEPVSLLDNLRKASAAAVNDGAGKPSDSVNAGGLQTQLQAAEQARTLPLVVVTATAAGHMEVSEKAPDLHPIKDLLQQHVYGWDSDNAAQLSGQQLAASPYTFDNMLKVLPVSAAQLRIALKDLGGVEVGGQWWVVDSSYMGSVLEMLIATAVQASWPLDALQHNPLAEALFQEGYHPQIVMHCLERFAVPNTHSSSTPNTGSDAVPGTAGAAAPAANTWKLQEDQVCRHFAAKVLASGPLPLSTFMREWERAVPSGFTPAMDMLLGEVLREGNSPHAPVRSFRSCDLPFDPEHRFDVLFRTRAVWQAAELEPYLKDLKVPGKSAQDLLLLYARKVQPTPTDPVLYSRR